MALSRKKFEAINEQLFGLPSEEYQERMGLIRNAVCGIENGASMALLGISTAIAIKVMAYRSTNWSEEELTMLHADLVKHYLEDLHASETPIN